MFPQISSSSVSGPLEAISKLTAVCLGNEVMMVPQLYSAGEDEALNCHSALELLL